jgi:hypothetical protein
MRSLRAIVVVSCLLIGLTGLGVGYVLGAANGSHPPVYVGSGYVGSDVVSLQVGDTVYGFRGSVAWTDRSGSFHADGWPDCLPHLQEVGNVRFAATTEWFGDVGVTRVSWVDCRS